MAETVVIAPERRGTDRRAKRLVSLHFPERRLGFDRRSLRGFDRMLLELAANPKDIVALIVVVIAANVLDAIITSAIVGMGIASEANPIMSQALGAGFSRFLLVKMMVIGVVVLATWVYRRYRMVLMFLVAVAIIYTFLVTYEVSMIVTSI